MCFRTIRTLMAASLLLYSFSPIQAGPPIEELLSYLPEQTNAALRIQVADIVKSPRGLREKWGQRQTLEYLAGTIPLHPNIERILVGTHFDPHQIGANWSISLIPTLKPVELETLAKKLNGKVEELGGEKVVASDRLGYFVAISDELIANVATNERQFCSQWIKNVRAKKKPVPGYLENAITFNDSAQITFAIETDGMIDPTGLYTALESAKVFQNDQKMFDLAVRFLVNLRGVRIAINFGEIPRAKIHLDSRVDAVNGLTALKDFLLPITQKNGTMPEDLPGAKVSVAGKTVTFDLAFSDSDLIKLTTLMGCPMLHAPEGAYSSPATPDAIDPKASQRHYKTVNQYVDFLKRNTKIDPYISEANTQANWYEVYTKKLSSISILNVDPDVLAYNHACQNSFKALGQSLRGLPIAIDKLEAQKYYYPTPVYGGYGYGLSWGGGMSTNIPDINNAEYELVQRDIDNRKAAWAAIEKQRQAVRLKMKIKYKIDFDDPLP